MKDKLFKICIRFNEQNQGGHKIQFFKFTDI